MANLVGWLETMLSVERLYWDDKFFDSGYYICNIDAKDVKAPIMFGIDLFGKNFITIRY